MKGKRFLAALLARFLALVVSAPPVLAGKSPEVIAKSNGFPSGMHFNLNVHGMDLGLDDQCTHEPGGNSVFIDLYGESTIQYKSDKRGAGTELEAIDPCASGDGLVTVSIPSRVSVTDESTNVTSTVAVDGYYVYGRILAKPQNGNNDPEERSTIWFSPNRVTEAYDWTEDGDTIVPMGLITWNEMYYDGGDASHRFDSTTAKGKGKSQARSMTDLFTYTGWVVDASLDTNDASDNGTPDGMITIEDVPLGDYDADLLTPDNRDVNNDGIEDDLDIAAWLRTAGDFATEYNNEWIFNIADVVTTEGQIVNDGTKLFQVRFYPYFED
jgi:hypothetical protein